MSDDGREYGRYTDKIRPGNGIGNVPIIRETFRRRIHGVSVPMAFPNGYESPIGVSVLQSCLHLKVEPELLLQGPIENSTNKTSCLTVGAYTKWIDGAPSGLSFLPSVIGILVSGISMSEDSAVAAALAFRTFVMICWVEERIVEGSIEGSVVHIQGVRTIIIRPSRAISSSGLGETQVLKLQAAPFTLRLSHRPLNTQPSFIVDDMNGELQDGHFITKNTKDSKSDDEADHFDSIQFRKSSTLEFKFES
ncbi:transportin MOS14 [Tanacetum coccineum]|uniref:Transportin MOS14 n=1 Tax=Tanacetum coccineum TaxID=301880 RepID=A0ABQ5HJ12_9ASTR